MVSKIILFALFVVVNFSQCLQASEAIFRSDLTLEVRQFEDDGEEETFENQRSIKLHIEGEKDWDKLESRFSLNARYDDQDSTRNIIWSEDSYLKYPLSNNLFISTGFKVFNYSYMEAFHPLDGMNAKIIDLSMVNSEKMGEPFVELLAYAWGGDLKFILTPYAIRPVLPGGDARLNLPQDFNRAVWIGQDGEEPDISNHFILSYEKTFDTFDILVLTSKGMDRSRLLIGTLDYSYFGDTAFPDSDDLYTPFYYERYLSGINGVYNFDSFQVKGSLSHTYYLADDEILVAESEQDFYLVSPEDYTTLALGIEKPLSHSNGMDSTFYGEYQTIFVDEESKKNFPIQNDLFLAWRLSFNDINSKEVTVSTVFDLESSEPSGFVGLGYSQRFWETWTIEVESISYFIPDEEPLSGLGFFRDKDNISFNLQKYF